MQLGTQQRAPHMLNKGTACSAATAGDTYCTIQCVCSRTKCHNSMNTVAVLLWLLQNLLTWQPIIHAVKSLCFMVWTLLLLQIETQSMSFHSQIPDEKKQPQESEFSYFIIQSMKSGRSQVQFDKKRIQEKCLLTRNCKTFTQRWRPVLINLKTLPKVIHFLALHSQPQNWI
jgi:hypothetical protein